MNTPDELLNELKQEETLVVLYKNRLSLYDFGVGKKDTFKIVDNCTQKELKEFYNEDIGEFKGIKLTPSEFVCLKSLIEKKDDIL